MNVTLQRAAPLVTAQGGRMGTCCATLADLRAILGEPSFTHGPETITDTLGRVFVDDPKVTMGWVFKTPRGPAEVRDYWWNRPGEQSIAAASHKAARWLAAYLRTLGVPASTRWQSDPDPSLRWVNTQGVCP